MSGQNCNPILVNHTRGGITESFHRGTVCVVDAENNVILSNGDIQQLCYPRSALKYFQHIPLILSGAYDHFGFTLKELAVMCGSHNGEEMHLQAVQGILDKIGLDCDNLGCGAQPPTLKSDYVKLLIAGKDPNALYNNCSGKHSGFLAYCKFNSLPIDTYLEADHPLHMEIKKYTALFHEIDIDLLVTGLDGCSAPIFAMPVVNQAIAYKNLCSPEKFKNPALSRACQLILEAVATYPEMVAGSNRYCTDLIRETKGRIIGKTGADGVYCIAVPENKWGICIKVDDGKMGPQYHIAQKLLVDLGLLTENETKSLCTYLETDNFNWAGKQTGRTIVPTNFTLNRTSK